MRHTIFMAFVSALLALPGCGKSGAGDSAETKPSLARPGEDQMKEAMMKGLQKPGAARAKGMPKR
ncbi:MAG TPA: hypothetical protein VH092_22385 [Urbifossiella sp.]|nr:hypothetical protein [Urbifossiella sp.]